MMNGKTTNQPKAKDSNNQLKVALGMSGGVDSSLAAHLLKEQGYQVTGVFLECWRAPGCRSEEDRQDALKVALSLEIPFKVLDFKKQYRDKVVEYFFEEYQAGRTPNPDVMCNKEIKFGMFYEWAMSNGYDFIATGHYAKKAVVDGAEYLAVPKDSFKDQTYFMHLMTDAQIKHTLFPLSDLTKDEVRREAEKRGIHVSAKKDSVGICFIGDINVHEFLKERLGENPGEVVDKSGNVIGRHQGLWFYTVGQRSGFTVDQTSLVKNTDGTLVTKHNIPPFYVIGKNPAQNQLIVGFGVEAYQQEFKVEKIHWSNREGKKLTLSEDLQVRIRHTGKLLNAKLQISNESGIVTLAEPAKGIAEGQSAVFYFPTDQQETICLGGGVITS